MPFSRAKIITSGTMPEVIIYRTPIKYGFKKLSRPKIREIKELTTDERRIRENNTLLHIKHRIAHTIKANCFRYSDSNGNRIKPLLLTLTFRENVTDLKTAHYNFKKFIQRFNWEFNHTKQAILKYTAVVEFQIRGAVHYHVVLYNLPFQQKIYDRINKTWNLGFHLVEQVKSVSHVANYLTFYLNKQIYDTRLKGRKHYFSSRGLYAPKKLRSEDLASLILQAIPEQYIQHKASYEREGKQYCYQTMYNLPEGKTIEDYLPIELDLNWLNQ